MPELKRLCQRYIDDAASAKEPPATPASDLIKEVPQATPRFVGPGYNGDMRTDIVVPDDLRDEIKRFKRPASAKKTWPELLRWICDERPWEALYGNVPPLFPDAENLLFSSMEGLEEVGRDEALTSAKRLNRRIRAIFKEHGQARFERSFFDGSSAAKARWAAAEAAIRDLLDMVLGHDENFFGWLMSNPHPGWVSLVKPVSLATMEATVHDKGVCGYIRAEWMKRWPDVESHWPRARHSVVIGY